MKERGKELTSCSSLNHVKIGNVISATITCTLYACTSLEVRSLNCHVAETCLPDSVTTVDKELVAEIMQHYISQSGAMCHAYYRNLKLKILDL